MKLRDETAAISIASDKTLAWPQNFSGLGSPNSIRGTVS